MPSESDIQIAHSFEEPLAVNKAFFYREMCKKMHEASMCLCYQEFRELFRTVCLTCIRKAEVQGKFVETLQHMYKWMEMYGSTLELHVRTLILESQAQLSDPKSALAQLEKLKHLLIDTSYEYLLPKVFVLQAKAHELQGNKQSQGKVLKKCIDYAENYLVEYLNDSNQTRLQIADNMVIANFEMYKLFKESRSDASIHSLTKAYKAVLKNYGDKHFNTQSLLSTLTHEKKLVASLHKMTPRLVTTQIQTAIYKRNMSISVFFNWEEETLIAVLKKAKRETERVVGEVELGIKLDMNSIKCLRNHDYSEYIQIKNNSDLVIIEEYLTSILSKANNQQNLADRKTNISLIPKNKSELIKHATEEYSSSEDDNDIQPELLFKYRHYGGIPQTSHSHISRSPSNDRNKK